MPLGDKVGIDAVKDLTDETLPALEGIVDRTVSDLLDGLHDILDRLDGTTITREIRIPPRGSLKG